jgi:PAS domain S-box-containing protein
MVRIRKSATAAHSHSPRVWLSYVAALALPCAILLAQIKWEPAYRGNPGLILYVFPVLLSAYLGGLGPGLVSTAVSAFLTNYFLLPPINSFSIASGIHNIYWLALIGSGTLISLLPLSRQASEWPSEAFSDSRFSLAKKVKAAFALALLCLGMIGFISYSSVGRSQVDATWVSHTHEVIAALHEMLATADNAETGERGFAITGKSDFLAPYDQAVQQIQADIQRVRTLTADNPSQQRRIDSLQTVLSRRLAILDEVIKTRQAQDFRAAEAIITSGEGERLQQQLRGIIHEMVGAENDLLVARSLRAQKDVAFAKSVIVLGSGFAFSLMLVAGFLIGRDFTGVRHARMQLLAANDALEIQVAERTAANEQLKDNREQLSLALDVAKLGTWTLYSPDNRMEWSPLALAAFGLPPETKLTYQQCLNLLHPDDRAKMVKAKEDSERTNQDFDVELRTIWADNSVHWIIVHGRPYPEVAGHPRRECGVVQEITQQKRAEEMLLRSQKLESLGTLAGGIAHDFNNILLVIGGNTVLAAEEIPANHPAQQSLLEISKGARRATDLVRQILAFSRPQDQKRQTLQLETVVVEAVKLMRSTIPAMIELRSNFAADLPLVSVDPTHVHQIIVNLITNASHAIGSYAGVIEVGLRSADIGDESFTVRRLTPGRYVILDIKDNGTGMDHETKARVFDPFFTTKPVGQGTGLGLSVVDGIVRGHGGGISLYSEVGKGTVFHIYFPIASSGAEVEKPRLATPIPHGQNRHVLYVDDEESLVSLVTRNLTRLGYRVTGFTDSEAALREFASGPGNFDAIVTDLAMPRLSGFELLRQVLTLRPNIPAVMTSGYLRPEDEEMAQQIGVKQVILKPNTTEELGFALDALLRNTGKGSD